MLIDLDEVPTGLPGNLFGDPAFKKPENRYRGDYNAFGLWLIDKHGRNILVDGFYRNDWGEGEVFMECGRIILQWRPLNFFMEQQFQGDIQPHWQAHAYRENIPITTMRPLEKAGRANKSLRIQSLEPDFKAGRIILVRGLPITNAILKEATGYDRITGPAAHDDGLDMTAQIKDPAALRAQTPFGTRQDPKSRAILKERRVWLPGNG